MKNAENTVSILKGNILYPMDEHRIGAKPGGYLICQDDAVVGVFDAVPPRYREYPITDYGDYLIIPGLTDLHVHAPQYPFRALGMDLELLPWLQTYTFPEESKYKEMDYAKPMYEKFVSDLKRSATTRAVIYGTLHTPATLALMDLLEESGMVTFVGKVNMDRNSIPELTEDTLESAVDTRKWIAACQARYQRTRPILTPRFIPSCSDVLMAELGKIQRETGLPVQSHLSENRDEIAWVSDLHPDTTCYGEAYAKYGLFGGAVPTVMAHCVHSTEEEQDRMKEQGVFIAHCPQSNMNLSSGVAPVRRFLDRGISVGLGSDVAGGTALSIFRAMADAIQASKMRWALLDDSLAPLTLAEAFYLGTAGGGAFFGKVGRFEPGYAFDALVIDDSDFETTADYNGLIQRLERLVYLGRDDQIVAKYVGGKPVF